MSDETAYVLFLDDYHAGDVLFIQGLSRAMARREWKPAPVLVHGSGEHAERLLESQGIFRKRTNGILPIESASEHALVERALRRLNQKLVALMTDAVVSSVGVIGAQRSVFTIEDGQLRSDVSRLVGIARQGVVPIVAANARDAAGGATGEIPLVEAAVSLARALRTAVASVEVVFFTRTNLPGIMREGAPRKTVHINDPALRDSVPEWSALSDVVASGLPVLLTNSNRFADPDEPTGTRVTGQPEGLLRDQRGQI